MTRYLRFTLLIRADGPTRILCVRGDSHQSSVGWELTLSLATLFKRINGLLVMTVHVSPWERGMLVDAEAGINAGCGGEDNRRRERC